MRFSSPLLTPNSNAHAQSRIDTKTNGAASYRTHSAVEAVQNDLNAYGDLRYALTNEHAFVQKSQTCTHERDVDLLRWKATLADQASKGDELALENSQLKALLKSADLELCGVRKQLRVAEERSMKLLAELEQWKEAAEKHDGKELAECKAMLRDISRELAKAYHDHKLLEDSRDKAEASLEQQLQTSRHELELLQKQLESAKEENVDLKRSTLKCMCH